jgi:hypothetical protein
MRAYASSNAMCTCYGFSYAIANGITNRVSNSTTANRLR